MKRVLIMAAGRLALASAGALSAAMPALPAGHPSTVVQVATTGTGTFAVPNLICALCPLAVKTAMERVEGVRSVEVDFATTTATFDPLVASVDASAAASTNAGYPANPAG